VRLFGLDDIQDIRDSGNDHWLVDVKAWKGLMKVVQEPDEIAVLVKFELRIECIRNLAGVCEITGVNARLFVGLYERADWELTGRAHLRLCELELKDERCNESNRPYH
jgi:hypothetical protein